MPTAYLDNAASTRLDPAVLDAMLPWLRDECGNASSVHGAGVKARAALDVARLHVLAAAGAAGRGARVVFTGSGTEANNLAVFGLGGGRAGDRIVISAVEHPSIRKAAAALAQRQGAPLVEAVVDGDGRIDLGGLAGALTEKTTLVCLMHAQNELGTIEPVGEAARIVRERAPRAHLHVDAIQSLGKLDLAPVAAVADSIALSAHKLNGPQGTGALVVISKRPVAPIVFGGGQEGGARSGTENVAGIVGFGAAAEIADRERSASHERLARCSARVVAAIEQVPDARVLARHAPRVPSIVAVAVRGLRGETLQHELESRGVIVGTGSACHAAKAKISGTFAGIGMGLEEARSVVRVSLSRLTTEDDVARFEAAFEPAVARLRALL